MFLILFVLHDTSKLEDVMKGWNSAGVNGITVLVSTGFRKITESNVLQEDMPLIFNIEDILQDAESTNRTLFSVVKDESTVDKVVEATQKVVGDLNKPNTGILTVIPASQAYGLDRVYD